MGAWKTWKDIQNAYDDELLALLDDQTRDAAIEGQWDLSSAALPIEAVLNNNIKIFNLAHSAYQFDLANPTTLQLSQRWAMVWEQMRKNPANLGRYRMRRKKEQRARDTHKGTLLPFAPWRLNAAIGGAAAGGGTFYLAATWDTMIFWLVPVAVMATYGMIGRPKRVALSERDWIAITKAVAHRRFKQIKPATLDVGIEHRNGIEDTADAIAALRPPVPADLRPDPARIFHRRRHMESNLRAAAGRSAPQGKSMAKRTELATRLAEFADQAAGEPALDTSTAPPKPDIGDADHARRVAGVHAALARLDEEWLEYESDWHAWSLAKPLLHVPDVPQTAAYNDALYDLREITYTLADTASVTEIEAAEKTADAALRAWDIAQDHAAAIGIADRSPLEQRTLRRLHHLVGQLADPSTPKPMWQGLITQIDRQLKNLETVPITWSHIQHLSALEASPRIQAIQQFAEVPHA